MKIFISYSRQEEKFVKQLKQTFRGFGILPKTVNLHRTLGNDVYDKDKLEEVIPNIDFVITVLSEDYVSNEWLNKELIAFYLKEKKASDKIIIPVLRDKCKIPDILNDGRKIYDLRRGILSKTSELIQFILGQRQAFVVMKLGDSELDSAYEGVIKPVIEGFKYSVVRIDKVEDSGRISEQILNKISRSEIIIADLTGERPNCYYEAGYAHALGKEIIFTVKDGEKVHFDLAGNRFIYWKTEDQLRNALIKRIEAIQKRELQFI